MYEPLAWLLPGLAGSVLLGIVVGDELGGVVRVGQACAVAGLAGAWIGRRHPRSCAACACIVAFGLGLHAISSRAESASADVPDEPLDAAIEARVCRLRHGLESSRVELCDATGIPFGERPGRASVPRRAELYAPAGTPEGDWLAGLSDGDRVRALLRFRSIPGARNPGARDGARRAGRRGIGARARLLDARLAAVVDSSRKGGPGSDSAWRARLAERLVRSGPGGRLLAALGLGDRRALEAEDREAFRRLGISHLLAVSGLHLALVGAIAFAGVRAVSVRSGDWLARADVRRVSAVAAGAAALGYGLLAGWGVPVQRAFVFLACAVFMLLLGRRPVAFHALAAAALVIAVVDPAAVFELGTQLSFVATAALVVGLPAAGGIGPATWRVLASGLRVSATAIAATAPLLATHGLATTWIGLCVNVVAVPLTGAVLLPAALLGVGLSAAGDGGLAALACERVGAATLAVVRLASEALPASGPRPPPVATAIAFAAVAALGMLGLRSTVARAAVCLGICLGLTAAPRARVGPEPPRVVAFAVGQGDAVLVQGRDAALLVDAGPAFPGFDFGRQVVAPGLRALGVERLDVVIASHADADHRGGLAAVVAAFEVGEIWLPRDEGAGFEELLEIARQRRVPVHERGRGDRAWQRGDLRIEPLWPPARTPGARSRNERSLVVRATVAGVDVLLTGDVGHASEAALLAELPRPAAAILKVAHHGSRGSSATEFLAQVGFELALVSAPCSAGSHLPSPQALDRLDAAGGSVWWTGRDGAVVVALDSRQRLTAWGWSHEPGCRGR